MNYKMRILAFSDIHEHTDYIKQVSDISNASCIIVAGDLTYVGGKKQAKKVIDCIREYNPNVYAVAGNFDRKEVEEYLIEQGISLHGNSKLFKGVAVFGVGGSNITPFHTPNEFDETEIESRIYSGYNNIINIPLKLLITHAPPFNTKADVIISGRHVGSKAIREFIEKHQPDVCVSGHIHEARSEDWIGRTHIINPGMLKNGGYVEIFKENGRLKAVLK